jgi:HlyD family secretion protein
VAGLLGLLVLVTGLLGGCAGGSAPAADVEATVVRGDVSRTAGATGALSGVVAGGAVAVVPFAEQDAVNLRPGQAVVVGADAVPGLRLDGTVQAVAPDAVTISGVTEYYVTIGLPGDSRLRAGMTVDVQVTTVLARGVLTVPNRAVVRDGATSSVDLPGGRRARFTPGAVGDQTTEVRAGLSEGQRVLLHS